MRNEARIKRKHRIRSKVQGSAAKPRLSVFRSSRHIYVQLVDDEKKLVKASASTLSKELREKLKAGDGKIKAAQAVGKMIAEKARKHKIEKVRFDRNGFLYHGRIKSLADAARENGLKF